MQECILVTGGAGFIGCAISDGLVDFGLPVVAVDCLSPQVHSQRQRPSALHREVELVVADVCEPATWDEILRRYRPKVVIHLCAETGTAQSLTNATLHTRTNAVGTSEMLDAFVRYDSIPELFVLSSSRAVYGEGRWIGSDGLEFYPARRSHDQLARQQWVPISPSTGLPGHPLYHRAADTMPLPTSIYGATKLTQEHLLSAWCSAFGSALSIMRIQNAYGVGQSPTNSYTGIINIFHKTASQGRAIDVYEDGLIGRDFIYISDVADAFIAAVRKPLNDMPVTDLGTGELTSILEAANIIAQLHNAPAPTISGKFRDGDVRSACADTTSLRERYNISPKVRPRDGFSLVGEWLETIAGRDRS